ncbi:MAG TPA: Lrp/AsnC family transcriptional regulator, partial [Allosphingosinicella sp.]|nr:Lrp/AsnC family transcriptional regulator [Allosphingosinicella sp.]
MDKKLDPLDLRLLGWVQADNLLTTEMLAERVGLSPSAVARRLRHLRSTRVIAGDVAIVSEQALGHPLSAIVNVQLERHALPEVASFKRQLATCDNVQFCL